jgi:phosphatidylinositol 3-kinase
MPVFDFPLVYDEDLYDLDFPMFTRAAEASFIKVVDLEMFRENPVENKHRKLVRSHRNGPMDRDLKPNSKIRDDLNVGILIFLFLISFSIH